MKLQELAQHTLDIEYPGMDLVSGLNAANERSLDALNLIRELEAQMQRAQYCLDHATQDYHDAVRAANLFENALDDESDSE